MLDLKDRKILSFLQNSFPIDPRPYKTAAGSLGLTEEYLIKKTSGYLKSGVIRYIGAVLDTKRAGMKSSLVAMAVSPSELSRVAGIINSYPQVTHNYLRDDEYNVWFTVSAKSVKAKADLIKGIKKKTGIVKCLDLDTVKTFKINARFRIDGDDEVRGSRSIQETSGKGLPRFSPRILSGLSVRISAERFPFEGMADGLGMDAAKTIRLINRGLDLGVIRRFGAVLDHYKVGLRTNALVAWEVKPGDVPACAAVMAGISDISHCYLRKTCPGWPYTIYTMIHSADRDRCGSIISLILGRIGSKIKSSRVLFTVRELKKTRFEPYLNGTAKNGRKKKI